MANTEWFDRFSLFHFGAGFLARKAGFGLMTVILGSLAFEYLEKRMKEANPDMFPNPSADTIQNSTGDILVTILGWYIG